MAVHHLQTFLNDVRLETFRARSKFPDNKMNLAALGEETGEVFNALIELSRRNKKDQDVYRECVQVAAMALRIALEGDAGFDYSPVRGMIDGTRDLDACVKETRLLQAMGDLLSVDEEGLLA